MALRGGEADPTGFTVVRLASGAIVLLIISYLLKRSAKPLSDTNWVSALLLFAYAACFSFAYLGLTAGTGALILFGAVQITMIGTAVFRGERPGTLEWVGTLTAIGGLIYLVLPGLSSPPLVSAVLMTAAGAAWGIYTLRGKSSGDPLSDTTANFVLAVPAAFALAVPYYSRLQLSSRGMITAAISGAVTSGLGYTAWYAALKNISATRAAVMQLSVPVIAAIGGILLLSEVNSFRTVVGACLVLGGIAVTILGKRR